MMTYTIYPQVAQGSQLLVLRPLGAAGAGGARPPRFALLRPVRQVRQTRPCQPSLGPCSPPTRGAKLVVLPPRVLTLCQPDRSWCSQALVPQMTAEVGAALSWVLDNCQALGGDPGSVSLVGHSAGAQLATMALLHRALAARDRAQGAAEGAPAAGREPAVPVLWQQEAATSDGDARMPARLVGLAGVYDLAKHFEYELGEVHVE